MFNLDEGKIECELGNKEFLAGQESRECCVFVSDVGTRGIYLSLDSVYIRIQTTRLIIFFSSLIEEIE